MNFYGHLVVAIRYRADPAFLLGSMLPDLAGMAGLRRWSTEGSDTLTEGVRFHHTTDDVFHRAPSFTRITSDGLSALESRGLGRGAARAVAHVGTELLLDGLLHDDPSGPGAEPYVAALSAMGERGLGAYVTTELEGEARLDDLLRRLAAAPIPARYREPAFVAARLEHILARRPRLALPPGGLPTVTAWLEETRERLRHGHGALLSEVHEGLRPEHGEEQ